MVNESKKGNHGYRPGKTTDCFPVYGTPGNLTPLYTTLKIVLVRDVRTGGVTTFATRNLGLGN